MRYLFLLGGFLAVIFVADIIGGNNQHLFVSIGGGIVYAIFSATKSKD